VLRTVTSVSIFVRTLGPAMLRLLFAVALSAFAASAALADDACFGSDADAMSAALTKAGSCRAAFAKFFACALAAFEARFTAIDECDGGADMTKCLAEPE